MKRMHHPLFLFSSGSSLKNGGQWGAGHRGAVTRSPPAGPPPGVGLGEAPYFCALPWLVLEEGKSLETPF